MVAGFGFLLIALRDYLSDVVVMLGLSSHTSLWKGPSAVVAVLALLPPTLKNCLSAVLAVTGIFANTLWNCLSAIIAFIEQLSLNWEKVSYAIRASAFTSAVSCSVSS